MSNRNLPDALAPSHGRRGRGGGSSARARAGAASSTKIPKTHRISSSGEPWWSARVVVMTRDDMLLLVEHAQQKREDPIHIEVPGGSITPGEAAAPTVRDMLVSAAAREFSEEMRGSLSLRKEVLAAAIDGGSIVEYVYPPEPPFRAFAIRSAALLIRTNLTSEQIGRAFDSTAGISMSRHFSEVRGVFFVPLTADLLRICELKVDPPVIEATTGTFFIKSTARKVLEELRLLASRRSMSPHALFYSDPIGLDAVFVVEAPSLSNVGRGPNRSNTSALAGSYAAAGAPCATGSTSSGITELTKAIATMDLHDSSIAPATLADVGTAFGAATAAGNPADSRGVKTLTGDGCKSPVATATGIPPSPCVAPSPAPTP